MYSNIQTYISIKKLSDDFDIMLFQLSSLLLYSNIHNKLITLPKQNNFIKNNKLFDNFDIDDYHIINDTDNNFKIIPYGKNILLSGNFETYKKLDENILNTLRNIVYNDEDYMYVAYELYNNIKKYFNDIQDNDIASIYYDDVSDKNLNYYKKSLIIMNKKNIVVFSPENDSLREIIDKDYNVYYIWHDNVYIRFILLSFFQHNIIQYSKPYYSLWASYISKYDELKNVVIPEYILKKINRDVNNTNFIMLT
jgi:hypothetical protein